MLALAVVATVATYYISNVSEFRQAFRDAQCCDNSQCTVAVEDECHISRAAWELFDDGEEYTLIIYNGTIQHNRSNTLGTPCHDALVAQYPPFFAAKTRRRMQATGGGGMVATLLYAYQGYSYSYSE